MERKSFVLVHGAWHGGWCWRRVSDILAGKGHRVFTPTLTGLGERSHLIADTVNLTTHITDIVNLLRWEELENILLCGHSYGGMVVTGAADRAAGRIASLVFLDAFVPENGQSLREVTTRPLPQTATIPVVPAAAFMVNEKDRAWVDRQCTPHPAASMNEKISLTGAWRGIKRKTYIRAGAYPSTSFDSALQRFQTDPGWTTTSVPCGHDVMVDMPEQLAELLEASL